MDSPTYPPAVAFELPVPAPYEKLTVETVSLAEMKASAKAWAIVLKHAPTFNSIVGNPVLQPLLTNMTVDSFITYGVITQATVDAMEQELNTLPRNEWPVQ